MTLLFLVYISLFLCNFTVSACAIYYRWLTLAPQCPAFVLAPRVCTLVLFILSVMRELTSPAIERVKNKLTYPAADEGQKICGIFSETALLKSYGVKKPTSMCLPRHQWRRWSEIFEDRAFSGSFKVERPVTSYLAW